MNILTKLSYKITFSIALGVLISSIASITNMELTFFVSRPWESKPAVEVSEDSFDSFVRDKYIDLTDYSYFKKSTINYSRVIVYGLISSCAMLLILLIWPNNKLKQVELKDS